MSAVNRSALRRCRSLLVKQLDISRMLTDLQVVDECFRFLPEVVQVSCHGNGILPSAAVDLLNRMEQTGNDETFERFLRVLRRHQRHLAAVLDETRNQLRKGWRQFCSGDDEAEENDVNAHFQKYSMVK